MASLRNRCRRNPLAATSSLALMKLWRNSVLAFGEPHEFLARVPSGGSGALKSPTRNDRSRAGKESHKEPRMSYRVSVTVVSWLVLGAVGAWTQMMCRRLSLRAKEAQPMRSDGKEMSSRALEAAGERRRPMPPVPRGVAGANFSCHPLSRRVWSMTRPMLLNTRDVDM